MDLKRGIDNGSDVGASSDEYTVALLHGQQGNRSGRQYFGQFGPGFWRDHCRCNGQGRHEEGVITVEEGYSLDNELAVVDGMQFDRANTSRRISSPSRTA